ncbi:tetratricopeptide repeat protein [Desulfomonile tiedjei]|uniref:tetratricopeptide repeat protein n=1 Tax=Desulfomonile tiedjei TaxID=2358 RepID=UPI0002D57003|nr:tetratricopeptide repeat protein [Desulfomonile tiedjei]
MSKHLCASLFFRVTLRTLVIILITAGFFMLSASSASAQLPADLRDALEAHRAGKLQEAVEIYTEYLVKNPKSAEAYNWRGMAYEDLGQLNKALADLNRALELSPNYSDAYNNRGEVYRRQNKFVEAMNDYRKATELEKDFAEPHYNMGLILEAQKKNELAIREFDTYLKFKPNAPDKQEITARIEALKKTAAATPAPPGTAPAPKAPDQKAPGVAPSPPGAPKPAGPRPGQVQIPPPPPPGIDLGIPGVPPIPVDILASLDIVSAIISLVFYLFSAGMLFLIAVKTNTSLPWLAFIPIANIILCIKIAGKPLWWLALFLLPILALPLAMLIPMDPTEGIIVGVLTLLVSLVPLVVWLFVSLGIASARGKSAVWGVLLFIPCTSFIGLAYLGLSK